MTDLAFSPAVELAAMVRRREVSSRELVQACLERIEAVNPAVNALCTVVADRALEAAGAADDALARGEPAGLLHGLPVGVKDTHLTAGVRTTFGSPLYAELVPQEDELVVERLKAAGAVMVGKTNVPELAAGSHTFNPLFGVTRNPYDLARSAGGSSGGAAAALAAGLVPLADGSDLGGSLRNPAGFCNVVGFRPSPGRVPTWPSLLAWSPLPVQGPLGRTVADVKLLLAALAGPDPRAPLALDEPGAAIARAPLRRDVRGLRAAWVGDFGRLPVERAVLDVLEGTLGVFEQLGARVEHAHPDLEDAEEVFQVLRAWRFALQFGDDVAKHRDRIKPEVVWNTDKGLALDGPTVARAEARRTEWYHRVRRFMSHHDMLLLPCHQVVPFPVEQRWPQQIEGVPMETYLDWMAVCTVVTLTGLPAVSVPAGFTADGLPVGLQIVGRHHADLEVLQVAAAFEAATGHHQRRPTLGTAA